MMDHVLLAKTLPKSDLVMFYHLAPKGYNVSTVQDEDLSSRDQWKRRKRSSYQNKLECWETCEVTCSNEEHFSNNYEYKAHYYTIEHSNTLTEFLKRQ